MSLKKEKVKNIFIYRTNKSINSKKWGMFKKKMKIIFTMCFNIWAD